MISCEVAFQSPKIPERVAMAREFSPWEDYVDVFLEYNLVKKGFSIVYVPGPSCSRSRRPLLRFLRMWPFWWIWSVTYKSAFCISVCTSNPLKWRVNHKIYSISKGIHKTVKRCKNAATHFSHFLKGGRLVFWIPTSILSSPLSLDCIPWPLGPLRLG